MAEEITDVAKGKGKTVVDLAKGFILNKYPFR